MDKLIRETLEQVGEDISVRPGAWDNIKRSLMAYGTLKESGRKPYRWRGFAQKLEVVAACIVLAGLVTLASLYGRTIPGANWWSEDKQIAREIQQLSETVQFTLLLPTWSADLTPSWAGPFGGPTGGVRVDFRGQSTTEENNLPTIHFIQSSGPITTADWGNETVTETVIIQGVTASLEYGYVAPPTAPLTRRGNGDLDIRQTSPTQRARLSWNKDGTHYLIDGLLVGPEILTRMAQSLQPLE